MFTGLVSDLGAVESVDRDGAGARIRIATKLAPELGVGDSVAVNGACLTAAAVDANGFEADVMNQTLSVTSLGPLRPGDRVNLELAIAAGERLGGHLVQGHVDGTGRVTGIREDGFARRVEIELPEELGRYVAEHGSIAVDGVSLTVAAVADRAVEVSLIPETLERTTLGSVEEGAVVNIEVDQIARYVERILSASGRSNDE